MNLVVHLMSWLAATSASVAAAAAADDGDEV